MFEITEFKLFKKGYMGVEAQIKAFYESPEDGRTIVEGGSRSRSLPIGEMLRKEINKLKYSYLVLTGHWIQPFNDRFDTEKMEPRVPREDESYDGPWQVLIDLWQKTVITGAKITPDREFLIKGYLEIIDKKPVNITTPQINMTDDFSFFDDTINMLNSISKGIIEYFTVGHILEQPRNTLKELAGYEEEQINELTDEEIEEQLIEILESKGAIILKHTDTPKTELPEAVKEEMAKDAEDNDPVPEPEPLPAEAQVEAQAEAQVPAGASMEIPTEDPEPVPEPVPEYEPEVSNSIPGAMPGGVEGNAISDQEYSENMGGQDIKESDGAGSGNW